MPVQLDYQNAESAGPSDHATGGLMSAIVAVASSALIIYISYLCRTGMARASVDRCGNGSLSAEFNLRATGLLLAVPAIACIQSLISGTFRRVCRTSFAAAVGGWLVMIVSTKIGLPF